MSIPLYLITKRNSILVKQIYQRAVIQSATDRSSIFRMKT